MLISKQILMYINKTTKKTDTAKNEYYLLFARIFNPSVSILIS